MGTGSSKGDIVSLGARDYHIERVMGRGAFGKVHCITEQKTKKYYAMKVMSKVQILKKGKSCIKSVLRERVLLSEIQNPFVVNMWGAIQDDRNLYLILDMMIGGELVFYLKSHSKGLPEEYVKFYAACLVLGLEYLHEKDMIHRDLKPENLLLDEKGYPHLTDFNVATKLDDDGLIKGFAGTRPYMAPEVFRKERYGKPVDMWGLGIVLFELLYGVLPWGIKTSAETVKWIDEFDGKEAGGVKDSELNEMTKRILRETVKIPKKGGKISAECREFLKGLICPAKDRMTAQECKNHPWLAVEAQWEELYNGKVMAPIQPRLDRPNIDKNMALVEMVMEEEERKDKKVKVTEEQQAQFGDWDWMCEELKIEHEKHQELIASGEIKVGK